jgi:flavodoxin-like protein
MSLAGRCVTLGWEARPKEHAMDALVVYESIYGNTRAVAEAVAEGLGGAEVLSVHEAATYKGTLDLLIVGGPTHAHGLASDRSRRVAVDAAQKDDQSHIDPDAMSEPGLRSWLGGLSSAFAPHAAAFDTRADKPRVLTGAASRGIARRLRHQGIDVVSVESFVVENSEGPLVTGEIDRARRWGAELAQSLSAPTDRIAKAVS